MLQQHVKEIDWLNGTMIEPKKLFKKQQTDAKNVLFTEETINDKILKKLKKSKYNKDIEFVNSFKNNIDFLDDKKSLSQWKQLLLKKKMILIGLPSIALMVLFNYYMLTLEI